jgi:outer membrane protein assembly factor BamB
LGTANIEAKDDVILTYSDSDEIIALNRKNGEEIWITPVSFQDNSAMTQKAFTNTEPTLRIDNSLVYASSKNGNLAAVNIQSGALIWNKNIKASKQFVLCGDFIFIICDSNKLVAIRKLDGTVKWINDLNKNKLPGEKKVNWSAPIVANSKVMLIGDNGLMLSFDPQNGKLLENIPVDKDITLPPFIIHGDLITISDNGTVGYYTN